MRRRLLINQRSIDAGFPLFRCKKSKCHSWVPVGQPKDQAAPRVPDPRPSRGQERRSFKTQTNFPVVVKGPPTGGLPKSQIGVMATKASFLEFLFNALGSDASLGVLDNPLLCQALRATTPKKTQLSFGKNLWVPRDGGAGQTLHCRV